jgi:putative DNA primase/helicase
VNATTFFQLLYNENVPGHLVLWTRQDKKPHWLLANNLEAASRLAEHLSSTCDVYFGVALQDKEAAFAKWRKDNPYAPREPTTRGCSETAVALPGLWADVDVRGPAHKAINLPPSKAAARALIAEFPFPPPLVIDSGHGLQAWWLFRELWIFDSEEERQHAQALARRFLATLQAIAQGHGWQIDPTADLARVLRVPGTFNRKLNPLPVRAVEYNETCRYNPSDFEEYLIDASPTEDPPRPQWHGASGAVDPVLQHCKFVQYCQAYAAELPEPHWYSLVSNLARLEGGKEAIHALSLPYPGYTINETDQKIAHAIQSAGPHTCRYIQQALGFTGCPPGGCGVKAPAALGLSQQDKRTAHVLRLRKEAEERARRILAKRQGVENAA